MDDSSGRSSMVSLAQVWSRRKWLAIFLFALAFGATLSLFLALPDLYKSTATVLVEQQQVPEVFIKSSVGGEQEARLHMLREKLISRAGLQALIERFDLYPDIRKQASMEAAVERMRKDILLELKEVMNPMLGKGSTVAFYLSYRGRDPDVVARVANTLASEYVEENRKMRERQAKETTALLKQQLDEVKARHEEQEKRISGFKQRHMGELPEQEQMNLSTLQRMNTELQVNSQNQMRILERRERLGKQLLEANMGGRPAATAGLPPDSLPARLEKLRTELTELRTKASSRHPDVIRLQWEISMIERQLAETASDAKLDPAQTAALLADPEDIKRALRELDAEMRAVKNEEQRLRQEIMLYQRRVERAPQHAQEFQQLDRDYKMTKDLYSNLMQRYQDALLAEAMEQGKKGEQFRILDQAIPAKAPSAPNRLRLILGGLVLSVGAAFGGVFLAEQRDKSFHDVQDLRAFTRVPVLVRIPHIATRTEQIKAWWRVTLRATASVVSLALVAGVLYYFAHGNEQLVWLLSDTKPAAATTTR